MAASDVVKIIQGKKGDIVIKRTNVIRLRFTFSAERYEHLIRLANSTNVGISQIIENATKMPCPNCGSSEIVLPTDLSNQNLKKTIYSKIKFSEK